MKFVPIQLTRALAVSGILLALSAQRPVMAQTNPAAVVPSPAIQPDTQDSSADDQSTLNAVSREVSIDVVALDQQNHPVPDLQQSDFQIFELIGHSKSPRDIAASHLIDPASHAASRTARLAGLRIAPGGNCATSSTLHYRLAFHAGADGWTSGFHRILVTTGRPGVHLSFRNHYYVGATYTPTARPRKHNIKDEAEALQNATCLHPDLPLSLSLAVSLIKPSADDRLRYSLLVPADSLAFTTLTGDSRHVGLDYGICTFDANGRSLRYATTSTDRPVSDDEYLQAATQGFRYELEIDRKGTPAFVRFVVRDRETGNLGSTEALIAPTQTMPSSPTRAARPQFTFLRSIGSFGSIVPTANALCGDVYELAGSSYLGQNVVMAGLPPYDTLDPVGQIYAPSLNIPSQILTPGALGVSRATEWFSIDYYGDFWIKNPGDYSFFLDADEGAQLYIDGQLVIDLSKMEHLSATTKKPVPLAAGRHTLRLPYAQGITHLALILKIKPPGEDKYQPFDLHDFPPNYRVNSRVLPGFQVVPTQP